MVNKKTRKELRKLLSDHNLMPKLPQLIGHSFKNYKEMLEFFMSLSKERIEKAFSQIDTHGWDFQVKEEYCDCGDAILIEGDICENCKFMKEEMEKK
jgi:hypothetical protein